MLTLITGASSSGKSLIAETVAINHCTEKIFYIATMKCNDKENNDNETKVRIAKHRFMRKDKNFITIEQPRNISEIEFSKDSTYLLECMSNLVANEMYHKEGHEENAGHNVNEGHEGHEGHEGYIQYVTTEKEEVVNVTFLNNKVAQKIILDMQTLNKNSKNLIIVTNEVFSEVTLEDEFCLAYLKTLAYINCEIAKIADVVIESVVGIPVYHKREVRK